MAKDDEAQETTIHTKVPVKLRNDFNKASGEKYHREPADLIRELMQAAADGRVKITPTEDDLERIEKSQELYQK